ncbi:MAG: hypothetical protein OEV10_10710 [Gammaproteobacteria bacterium]|nr:hypothetical protein [Gammaproteobacteria bacterium]MDH3848305.1 hypothetical protein [Gammaproteobacteria bacterium]MDH3864426.1 hypothetical protein [Gammaproteobacteria bacterium]
MTRKRLSTIVFIASMLISASAQAQQFEAVYSLHGVSSSEAKAAMEDLFSDPAMTDARVTLYAADFGVRDGSHKIVADFDSYAERMAREDKRRASHGWSRWQLAMLDAEFVAAEMVAVVADYGKPRHTAGYLLVYLVNVQDAGVYAAALKDMNDALGNPGVLRLVAMRSGSRAVTHAVLIGGDDFAAVNNYMDKLYASDAFRTFVSKVSDIRSVVHIESYRKVGAWGY